MRPTLLHVAHAGRLRREFILQDEGVRFAPPRRLASLPRGVRHGWRGFTLHMAQLSSLPCRTTITRLTLTICKDETAPCFILPNKLPPEAPGLSAHP
jgi:hypothetical protein